LSRIVAGPAPVDAVGEVPCVYVTRYPWSDHQQYEVPDGCGTSVAASVLPPRDMVLAYTKSLPQAEAARLWAAYERQDRLVRERMVDQLVMLRDGQMSEYAQLDTVRACAPTCQSITLVDQLGRPEVIALYPWGEAPLPRGLVIRVTELGEPRGRGEHMPPALTALALLAWYYAWDTDAEGRRLRREDGTVPPVAPWPQMLEVVGPPGGGPRIRLRVHADGPVHGTVSL
jgi:hypothetical protein